MNSDHHGADHNIRGILAMTVGTAGFVTNDMLVKLASETLPTSQIIFVRGSMTTLIMLVIGFMTNALGKLPQAFRPAVGWRALGEASATLLYLFALFHMPIANASAIIQAMPVVITIAAVLFLGERVCWQRWLAIGAGFTGILMIVQPGGEDFNAYGLFAVAALAFIVVRDLSTRYIPIFVPAIVIAFVTSCFVTLSGAIWGLAEYWVVPTAREFLFLAAAAVMLTAGYFFLVDGVRYGEISAVAPFRYTYLIWAILYGILIWGEAPDLLASFGIVLIAASGLVIYGRESRSLPAGQKDDP